MQHHPMSHPNHFKPFPIVQQTIAEARLRAVLGASNASNALKLAEVARVLQGPPSNLTPLEGRIDATVLAAEALYRYIPNVT